MGVVVPEKPNQIVAIKAAAAAAASVPALRVVVQDLGDQLQLAVNEINRLKELLNIPNQ
jgi:hypothetical protein